MVQHVVKVKIALSDLIERRPAKIAAIMPLPEELFSLCDSIRNRLVGKCKSLDKLFDAR